MFSFIVEQVIYQRLSTDPTIVGTVGESIHGTMAVPQGETLPAMVFYMENSRYDGAVNSAEDINYEEISFIVKFMTDGTSTDPILEAALRQFELLAGLSASVEVGEHRYTLNFRAESEAPLPTVQEGQYLYRQLGTVYTVEVFRS